MIITVLFSPSHSTSAPKASATNLAGARVLLSIITGAMLVNELGMNNDKVRRESFAVIRNPQTIAVLVEVGYLIKPEDNAKLVNSKFQDKAAIAIMHGLENYLNDLYE